MKEGLPKGEIRNKLGGLTFLLSFYKADIANTRLEHTTSF